MPKISHTYQCMSSLICAVMTCSDVSGPKCICVWMQTSSVAVWLFCSPLSQQKNIIYLSVCLLVCLFRDDQNVKDDWREAAGADAPGAQADAGQLHEHRQRAAACSYIRCVPMQLHMCLCLLDANGIAGHWASNCCYGNTHNYSH